MKPYYLSIERARTDGNTYVIRRTTDGSEVYKLHLRDKTFAGQIVKRLNTGAPWAN